MMMNTPKREYQVGWQRRKIKNKTKQNKVDTRDIMAAAVRVFVAAGICNLDACELNKKK